MDEIIELTFIEIKLTNVIWNFMYFSKTSKNKLEMSQCCLIMKFLTLRFKTKHTEKNSVRKILLKAIKIKQE